MEGIENPWHLLAIAAGRKRGDTIQPIAERSAGRPELGQIAGRAQDLIVRRGHRLLLPRPAVPRAAGLSPGVGRSATDGREPNAAPTQQNG